MKKFIVGKKFVTSFDVEADLIENFANFSEDYNPIHLQEEVARKYGHPKQVAHGVILMAKISQMIGTKIPGCGAIWLSQEITWVHPVFLDDHIKIILEIAAYSVGAKILSLKTTAFNQNNIKVMEGMAKVKVGVELTTKVLRKKSKRALVTGGLGTIGNAVCQRLAKNGYDLFITYRNDNKKSKLIKKNLERFNVKCELIKIDLLDPLKNWKKKITNLGPLDIFIHCASSDLKRNDAEQIDIQDLRKHMRISCESAIEIVNLLVPQMIKKKFGRFIFIGTSALKDTPQEGWSSYLMSKHALWGYVKNLAVELGSRGITANMISPSLVITNFTAEIPHRAKEVEAMKNPTRRLAVPEDISETIGYICGDEASFINGQNIFLTGGT